MPAVSVGETADIAGLATRSTAGDSSCTGTIFGNGTTDLSHTPCRRRRGALCQLSVCARTRRHPPSLCRSPDMSTPGARPPRPPSRCCERPRGVRQIRSTISENCPGARRVAGGGAGRKACYVGGLADRNRRHDCRRGEQDCSLHGCGCGCAAWWGFERRAAQARPFPPERIGTLGRGREFSQIRTSSTFLSRTL